MNKFKNISKSKALLVFIAIISFSVISYGFASKIPSLEVSEKQVQNPTDKVFELIYDGQFKQALQLIEKYEGRPDARLVELKKVLEQQEKLTKEREAQEDKLYKEQLQKLEDIQARWEKEPNDVNDNKEAEIPEQAEVQDIPLEDIRVDSNDMDPNDVADVNEITEALSVIANAKEYADEKQQSQLFNMPFVKKVVERSIDKAADFEEKGQWLDAYVVSYSWLKVIFEDNELYDEYAEDLLDKANIVASFKDSPCETSKERYSGIRKEMFYRTLDALNYNYVGPIDYKLMATEGIRRCDLLAEVLTRSFSEISESKVAQELKDSGNSFASPDSKQLAVWKSKIDQLKAAIKNDAMGMTKNELVNTFEKILKINKQIGNLPEPLLVAQFAEGALSALDPYTVMIWPKQIEDFQKALTNEFTGIGIHLSQEKGKLKVASLLPDTPAYHSGLDAGDLIEKIDGVTTEDMSTTCAVKRITGPRGTDVTLTIRRPADDKADDKIMDITITRDKIVVPTVRGWQRSAKGDIEYMIDKTNKIGYIKLTNFDEKTADEFEKVLKKLESSGLKGLILDLRGNPGGLLNIAHEIADMFIQEGLIVSTRPRFGIPSFLSASKSGTHPNYPLAVLINSNSASASEIVAGALQDEKYDRAVIVGERSHGKGSVQTIVGHPGWGAQLKYTMAYYHLPSGQRVESRSKMEKQGKEDWGIAPDVEVILNTEEYKQMSEIQWDNLVLVRKDHDSEAKPVKKYGAQKTIDSDPQLETALMIIKAKLIEDNKIVAVDANFTEEK